MYFKILVLTYNLGTVGELRTSALQQCRDCLLKVPKWLFMASFWCCLRMQIRKNELIWIDSWIDPSLVVLDYAWFAGIVLALFSALLIWLAPKKLTKLSTATLSVAMSLPLPCKVGNTKKHIAPQQKRDTPNNSSRIILRVLCSSENPGARPKLKLFLTFFI